MKILQNNKDRTIVINSETNFGTDLGWEENFQEFEQETLKSIINPAENFETVRYIHSGYTGEEGIYQHDIWFEFYFANYDGDHDGGLNYEFIGLSGENNSKLLRSDNTSFFRLEFYKVPQGEDPNSNNRKLVFSKNLPIPFGETLYYTPIEQNIYVPVFVGSNYRNKENMYLYWFQDDTVLEGTLLSGDTFYMAAKFYNTIDGTSISFLNKEKNVSDPIDEEEDMYRKVVINRSDYSYVIYTGLTEDHRAGGSGTGTPLRMYAGSISNGSLDTPTRESFEIVGDEPKSSAFITCLTVGNTPTDTIYLSEGYSEPTSGQYFYIGAYPNLTGYDGGGSFYRVQDIPFTRRWACEISSEGEILSVQLCY